MADDVRLVARVSVAVPQDHEREEWPAFFVRGGLAIHPTLPRGDGFTISSVPTGWRIGMFDRLTDAEAAFVRLEKVTDWTAITDPAEAARVRGPVEDILFECGELRRRAS